MSTSRAHRSRVCIAMVLAIVSLTLSPASRAASKKKERLSARVSESVQDHLQRIEAHLAEEEWPDALSSSKVLLRDFSAKVTGGEAAGPLLGMALLLRAVAESGLGRTEAALWDWHSAVTLFPGLLTADLAKYGAAGKLLEENKPIPRDPSPIPGVETPAGSSYPDEVTPPKMLHARPPAYPKGLLLSCGEGRVVIGSVIDEQGRPTKPVILEAPGGPVAAYAALEALQGWRFRPASLAGKPVAVYYTLTVSFSIPDCG